MSSILDAILANVPQTVADPNGRYPACKNKLGAWTCERCGRDVRNTTDACPAVPKDKRWSFKR